MALYSKSVQNAVTILTYIAGGGDERPQTVREVSEGTGISAPTVGKTVQPLVKKRVLNSRKGPGGGFVLAHPPGEISLWIIVLAIDGRDPFEDCVAGWPSCSEENVCPLHERWKPVKTGLHEFLESTTLEDMVRAVTETKASEIPLASGGLKLFAGKSLPSYPQGSGR